MDLQTFNSLKSQLKDEVSTCVVQDWVTHNNIIILLSVYSRFSLTKSLLWRVSFRTTGFLESRYICDITIYIDCLISRLQK